MNTPKWLKPVILGGIAGGILTVIFGFNAGGWMTKSTADRIALDKSKQAVIEALVPICLSQQKSAYDSAAKLKQLAGMPTSYEKRDFVMSSGWATMPGATEPNRDVAGPCADVLAKVTAS